MVTNIKLGPEGGPFVELDEDTGDFIIRVPNDSVDFDLNDLSNISNLIADSAEIDGNASPYAQDPHDVGGAQHAADTLANLNSKVSDATLDDVGDAREPEAHSGTHENGGTDEMSVAGLAGVLADPQPTQTQDDGANVVASSTLNFGNVLNVTDDAGDAKIDVNTNALDANIPPWTLDANSPGDVDTTDPTVVLDGTYDLVKVMGYLDPESTSQLWLQVNGDSGTNYNTAYNDGTISSGQNYVDNVGTIRPGGSSFVFTMSGDWQYSWNYLGPSTWDSTMNGYATSANNENVTGPLNQFTLKADGAPTVTGRVEVYGWSQ